MLIELNHIKKEFPSTAGTLEVLENISLNVHEGESIAIVGPSGSGKSTLLNIIGALDKPTSGEVLFESQNLSSAPENKLAEMRNRNIGFIFQLHHLLPQCTVLENVLIPTIPVQNKNNTKIKERAEKLLKSVGLQNHICHYPPQLSGGELQRVAVVRALINEPKLILADEPTGSLDHKNAVKLTELLLEINTSEKVAIIMVTHSIELAKMMNKVYEIKDGSINQIFI